ncbi:hypothetical protein HDU96_008794 [Phlyctochytrium bullatum]|nr:hypothetical protein HDU96_008794 [Phlyctochytrium bullatum]
MDDYEDEELPTLALPPAVPRASQGSLNLEVPSSRQGWSGRSSVSLPPSPGATGHGPSVALHHQILGVPSPQQVMHKLHGDVTEASPDPGSIKARYAVYVHFGEFVNIDIYQRGYYCLQCRVFSSKDGETDRYDATPVKVVPFGPVGEKDLSDRGSKAPPKLVQRHHCTVPAHAGTTSACKWSCTMRQRPNGIQVFASEVFLIERQEQRVRLDAGVDFYLERDEVAELGKDFDSETLSRRGSGAGDPGLGGSGGGVAGGSGAGSPSTSPVSGTATGGCKDEVFLEVDLLFCKLEEWESTKSLKVQRTRRFRLFSIPTSGTCDSYPSQTLQTRLFQYVSVEFDGVYTSMCDLIVSFAKLGCRVRRVGGQLITHSSTTASGQNSPSLHRKHSAASFTSLHSRSSSYSGSIAGGGAAATGDGGWLASWSSFRHLFPLTGATVNPATVPGDRAYGSAGELRGHAGAAHEAGSSSCAPLGRSSADVSRKAYRFGSADIPFMSVDHYIDLIPDLLKGNIDHESKLWTTGIFPQDLASAPLQLDKLRAALRRCIRKAATITVIWNAVISIHKTLGPTHIAEMKRIYFEKRAGEVALHILETNEDVDIRMLRLERLFPIIPGAKASRRRSHTICSLIPALNPAITRVAFLSTTCPSTRIKGPRLVPSRERLISDDDDVSDAVSQPPEPCDSNPHIHLVVLVHGLLGSSADLRAYRNRVNIMLDGVGFAGGLGSVRYLLSASNEGAPFADIRTQADNLVKEILTYVKSNDWEVCKLSFVCHSLGGIIARCAIAIPEMAMFRSKLLSPFYRIVGGLDCLKQLAMNDSSDLKECLLYKLALPHSEGGMNYLADFEEVKLYASVNDGYVEPTSALATTLRGGDDSIVLCVKSSSRLHTSASQLSTPSIASNEGTSGPTGAVAPNGSPEEVLMHHFNSGLPGGGRVSRYLVWNDSWTSSVFDPLGRKAHVSLVESVSFFDVLGMANNLHIW